MDEDVGEDACRGEVGGQDFLLSFNIVYGEII